MHVFTSEPIISEFFPVHGGSGDRGYCVDPPLLIDYLYILISCKITA